MRIALIARRFDPSGGGTERDLMVTAHYLREAGHQVTIYADEVRAHSTDWTVHRVPVGAGRALRLRRFAIAAPAAARRGGAEMVVSFARTIGADVLRSGGGAHASYIRAARRWRGALGAGAMRLSAYHRTQIAVERRAFASPALKCTVAVSNFVRDDLLRRFSLAPERVVTIYNGVDLDRFHPIADAAARARIRRRVGVAEGVPMVVFAGDGFARKGLEFLLRAWPRLAPAASLVVAGEDRAILRFRRLTRRLGVAGRVHFAGRRRDLAEIFAAADAFALPSLFEPFGNVVMEAMAAGTPALASAFCGVAELMPDSMRGFVVDDPADLEELAAKLGALLDRCAALRAAARGAAERFTWDDYGRRFVALVESLG